MCIESRHRKLAAKGTLVTLTDRLTAVESESEHSMTVGDLDASRDESPGESPPALSVRDLTVSYQSRKGVTVAVDNVSFDALKGSFTSLVGPSGCGKSTILNVVAGFVPPTSGEVLISGEPVRGPGADRAVVHQQTAALLPWLSVADNVGLGLRPKGMKKADIADRVASYLHLVGLDGFGRSAIYELSGGMQQRVALARALAIESPIVLLDEPLGAIDALQREMMQDLLLRTWFETKRTFLLITHSVEEAVYLSTEVLVMCSRPGRVIADVQTPFGAAAIVQGAGTVKRSPEFVDASNSLLEVLMSREDPTK